MSRTIPPTNVVQTWDEANTTVTGTIAGRFITGWLLNNTNTWYWDHGFRRVRGTEGSDWNHEVTHERFWVCAQCNEQLEWKRGRDFRIAIVKHLKEAHQIHRPY